MEIKTSWQYIAGFYDGEGTIGFRVVRDKRSSRRHGSLHGWYITPYMQLANTHLGCLEIIKDFLKNEGINAHIISIKYNTKPNNQPAFYLSVQAQEHIRKFINNIYPCSLIKKKQIDIYYKYFDILHFGHNCKI